MATATVNVRTGTVPSRLQLHPIPVFLLHTTEENIPRVVGKNEREIKLFEFRPLIKRLSGGENIAIVRKAKHVSVETTFRRRFDDFKEIFLIPIPAECNGRPNQVVMPENIEKILKFILSNRKVMLQEIAGSPQIPFFYRYLSFIQGTYVKFISWCLA